jgi:hypothetical protein
MSKWEPRISIFLNDGREFRQRGPPRPAQIRVHEDDRTNLTCNYCRADDSLLARYARQTAARDILT